jgi:hypothetical protein
MTRRPDLQRYSESLCVSSIGVPLEVHYVPYVTWSA